MTKDEFIKNGYREYPVGILEETWAQAFVQKRVTDKNGTRYFINVYISKTRDNFKSAELIAKVQLDTPRGTCDLDLWHFKNISDMEQFFERAWETFQANYYERIQ